MDAHDHAPTSGISTVPHEGHGFAASRAEADAARTAERQAKNLPWWCSKLKLTVINAQCRELHTTGDYRACQECGIPYSLPKEEGQDMAAKKLVCPECGQGCAALYGKGVKVCWKCYNKPPVKKAEPAPAPPADAVPDSDEVAAAKPVEASEPSWDDFAPIVKKPAYDPRLFLTVQSGKKMAVSTSLAEALGLTAAHYVQARIGQNAVAMRFSIERVPGALKLTPGRGQGRLAFGGGGILAAIPTPPGRYEVTRTSWGAIAHLDRPVEG